MAVQGQNKEQMAKKEFAWDTETKIGEYGNTKERHTVNICTLNGNTYVQDMKEVMTAKNGWKRTKGNTMKLGDLKNLYEFVSKWEALDANGPEESKEVPKQGGLKGLKAKQQAKGSAPSVKGKKSTALEMLEKNENFGSLTDAKQASLIKEVERKCLIHPSASVGISKTNYMVYAGVCQQDAETHIKNTKGFARSQVTYIKL